MEPGERKLTNDELPASALGLVVEALAGVGDALSDYRAPPLGLHVRRRMEALGLDDVAVYASRLRADAEEVERLLDVLHVQVTSFFRDPDVFQTLCEDVLPALLRRAGAENRPLRAWVVGTATGQEAYSLAMLLMDLGVREGIPFEVMATDRSEAALERARLGVYTEDDAASLPADLRRRFLVPAAAGEYRIEDSLRARLQFLRHDVLGPRLTPRESVVASFDIVLCRNVIIYFEVRAQALALDRFAGVVVPGGALVLGHSEAVPVGCSRFAPFPGVDSTARIYERTAPAGRGRGAR